MENRDHISQPYIPLVNKSNSLQQQYARNTVSHGHQLRKLVRNWHPSIEKLYPC